MIQIEEQVEQIAYSVEQISKMLGVSKPTVYRAMKAGQIPYFYVGDMRRIPKAALDKLLTGRILTTTQ